MRLCGEKAQKANWSAAGDQNALTKQRTTTLQPVQNNGQRFCEGGFIDRDMIFYFVSLPAFSNEALPKAALNMWHWHCRAVKAHVEAVVLLALEAEVAVATGPTWGDGNLITDAQMRDASAECSDPASNLVA
jgi:hypothetical protein